MTWIEWLTALSIFLGGIVIITTAAVHIDTVFNHEHKKTKWWVAALGAPLTIPLAAGLVIIGGVFYLAEWVSKHGVSK